MRGLFAIILYLFLAGPVRAQGFAWFSCEHRPDTLVIADAIHNLQPDLVITQTFDTVQLDVRRCELQVGAGGPPIRIVSGMPGG